MNIIKISGCNIQISKKSKSVISTLSSIYGVGRVRASKISDLLLNNPRAKQFKTELVVLSQESWVQKLFKAIKADNQLKLAIFADLDRKFAIKCYSGIRILQNLPSRGQRTHTNAGTPKRVNPFVKLGIKNSYVREVIDANKRWELTWNGRSSDLLNLGDDKKRRKFNKGAKEAKAKEKTVKTKKKK